jgi:hypothetical protein
LQGTNDHTSVIADDTHVDRNTALSEMPTRSVRQFPSFPLAACSLTSTLAFIASVRTTDGASLSVKRP